jgi:hypothetical protein
MKLRIVILACLILSGCDMRLDMTRPQVQQNDLVGSYVYYSRDPADRATDHEWDHLTLCADGKYVLVQGGPTKARSETAGVWKLFNLEGQGPELDLNHRGYPIYKHGNELILMINGDTSICYVRVQPYDATKKQLIERSSMQQSAAEVLISFVPLLLMSLMFGFIARALAKEKGRDTTLWTILGFIPLVNLVCMPFFIGASNLTIEKKLDDIMERLNRQ